MKRAYYSDSISSFLSTADNQILGQLAKENQFALEQTQRDAWLEEIRILKNAVFGLQGSLYFEYSIPRMGKRIDVVVLIGPAIFVLEFKVGESEFTASALDQVWDYALDLKNFHEPSHNRPIVPILVATRATTVTTTVSAVRDSDGVFVPVRSNTELLRYVLTQLLPFVDGPDIDPTEWEQGRYCPTPTIVEAALALYNHHSVSEISRSDASAINLSDTSDAICDIIARSRTESRKAICFVTGVPGAGKTLVGLNIATKYMNPEDALYSVFLSGNQPLVTVLQEALARDQVRREKSLGNSLTLGKARSKVKAFIQNVHHFRDACLRDTRPPVEHVALFDEAQRAWTLEQTANFMRRKKGEPNFKQSEPEFLISCLNRHADWAVVVCLVGGGQEINTGEAGISEWFEALDRTFQNWHIYVSSRLGDSEYGAGKLLEDIASRNNVTTNDKLHLAVSMRSFRAEHVSLLVKQLLDLDADGARQTLARVHDKFPVVITRDLKTAKEWLKKQARGSERYGIVVSSQAERLKPHAIDVHSPMYPIHWFLDGKEDVRSSYYLEAVATEFDVQGLELDWACVTWDADFRYSKDGWDHRSFVGDRWNHIHRADRQEYQKNAYRVLLTRARQGMVIAVPPGDPEDPTRLPKFYDSTYEYLRRIGFCEV